MIRQLRDELFAVKPRATLYHYTSLPGLMGIIQSRKLRASDVRYMNDSTELTYALNLLRDAIESRKNANEAEQRILSAFSVWLRDQINTGPMLFSASFRESGNLLSQWRGYSTHGKGVSLGFNPAAVQKLADQQVFSLGKCIYEPEQHIDFIERIIDRILKLCLSECDLPSLFDEIEGDLLAMCALFKHPAFAEEQEWRLVSPTFESVADHPIAFREGKAMLVPHYLFDLEVNGSIVLDHVFVGPTPNAELSVNALAHYLKHHNAYPQKGINDCEIPYR